MSTTTTHSHNNNRHNTTTTTTTTNSNAMTTKRVIQYNREYETKNSRILRQHYDRQVEDAEEEGIASMLRAKYPILAGGTQHIAAGCLNIKEYEAFKEC